MSFTVVFLTALHLPCRVAILGHYGYLEQPEAANTLIIRFLSRRLGGVQLTRLRQLNVVRISANLCYTAGVYTAMSFSLS